MEKPKLILHTGASSNTGIEVKKKSFTSYVLEQAAVLENIPTFYKLLFLTCFYLFFYKIFYDIGIFFGLNTVELVLYMAWFGMLILFLAFLSPNRSRLY